MTPEIYTRSELEGHKIELSVEPQNLFCDMNKYCSRRGQYAEVCATHLSVKCPFNKTYRIQLKTQDLKEVFPAWLRVK